MSQIPLAYVLSTEQLNTVGTLYAANDIDGCWDFVLTAGVDVLSSHYNLDGVTMVGAYTFLMENDFPQLMDDDCLGAVRLASSEQVLMICHGAEKASAVVATLTSIEVSDTELGLFYNELFGVNEQESGTWMRHALDALARSFTFLTGADDWYILSIS